MTDRPALYLPGLNGLRAIAAAAVVYAHLGLALDGAALSRGPSSDAAGFGVTVFFALSGFLVTYLLIREREETGSVAIGLFYARRALRIWPLYFIYLAGLVAVRYAVEGRLLTEHLAYYLVFLPNIPSAAGHEYPLAGHYWSLGVEEQFYLIWPILVVVAGRQLLRGMVAFIGLFIAAKIYADLVFGGHSVAYTFLYATRVDCMALGGIGAWIYHARPSVAAAFGHRAIQLSAWGVMVLVAFNRFHTFSIIDHELLAVATVLLIWGQIVEGVEAPVRLETPILNGLGKVSYGIYVYHPGLFFVMAALWPPALRGWLGTVAFHALALAATVAVAFASYRYLERPFLRLKDRFSVVRSTATTPAPGPDNPPQR